MAKTDKLQGSLDLLVLKILSRRAPLHGYAIMTAIEEISGEVLRVEEGSLYPALHRMEEAGLIRASWIVKDKEKAKRSRVYELTPEGRRQLAADEERWTTISGAVLHVLKHA
jgi:PadR family transcriptional regulator PadR